MPEPLEILFRDAHYVAIDKPPGLLVHRSPLSGDRRFVLQTLRDQLGRRVYPVHRLDRATSGVLLFGLSAPAAGRLGTLLETERVRKAYLAVTRGWVEPNGVVDHPLIDTEGRAISQAARTRYRRLAAVELPFAVDRYPSSRYSLVEVWPETGRRHQIRKHFKHISHHLIGDTTYGKGPHNRFFRDHFGIGRLLLMSWQLMFEHPYSGQAVQIAAGLDAEWQAIARLFGIDLAAGGGTTPIDATEAPEDGAESTPRRIHAAD